MLLDTELMLDSIITSKTRLKLLIKFFVSSANRGYLRGIAEEFNESTNSIRKELNQLADAGYLIRSQEHKKIYYSANTNHPLFASLQNLVRTYLGVDQTIDYVLEKAGDVSRVVLLGDYAKGLDSGVIDVLIEGEKIDSAYLLQLSRKTEELLKKRIIVHFTMPQSNSACIVLYDKNDHIL